MALTVPFNSSSLVQYQIKTFLNPLDQDFYLDHHQAISNHQVLSLFYEKYEQNHLTGSKNKHIALDALNIKKYPKTATKETHGIE